MHIKTRRNVKQVHFQLKMNWNGYNQFHDKMDPNLSRHSEGLFKLALWAGMLSHKVKLQV